MNGRNKLIAAIHAEAKARGIDDDTRRDLMARETGKTSCADMTERELARTLGAIKRQGAARPSPLPDNAYGRKLRALWISAWNLGVVRDRTDEALAAFIQRQTGLDAARFLYVPEDAEAAIEALKDWLHREAGVDWSAFRVSHGNVGSSEQDPRARVIYAQWHRLAEIGAVQIADTAALDMWASTVCAQGVRSIRHLDETQKDAVIRSLGAKLRKAMKAATAAHAVGGR